MSTTPVVIDLQPADPYRTRHYGILMSSATVHDFTGRGIHNRHHAHQLDVWENRQRPDYAGQAEAYTDPSGRPTAERYSFRWSAQATVIAAHPIARPERGATLQLGSVVTLRVNGYELGDFQVRARPLHDPHMVQVDTSASASRQHFIDTGDYLTPAELKEI